jgi:hypothetical protein
LETSQWQLVLKQAQFDARVFMVFRNKLRDHATRMQAVRLQWRARALSANKAAVHSWLSTHTLVENWEKSAGGEALREQLRWKAVLEKSQQLPPGSLAPSLLNLCEPAAAVQVLLLRECAGNLSRQQFSMVFEAECIADAS